MLVRGWMSSDVVLTSPGSTLQAAASAMKKRDVGFLPVVEGDRIVGVITDRDTTVRASAAGVDSSRARVGEWMTKSVVSCFGDQPLHEAERLFAEHRVRRRVVLDREQHVVGVLSRRDLAAQSPRDVEAAFPRRGAPLSPATVIAGSAHPDLAVAIARRLGTSLHRRTIERFPDGETHVAIEGDLRDHDVVLVQPTAHPVGDHLLELLLLADACWRGRARSVSAVIPYFGYARQDRRTKPGEALGLRVASELLERGRFARIVAVDLHGNAVEASLGVPLVNVTAVPVLAEALRRHVGPGCVVVAPDMGATKLARAYAKILDLPLAIVHKMRLSGSEVQVERVLGDVRNLRPVLVDDMITTGGTIVAALKAVIAAGCASDALVAASHALLVGPALERLRDVPVSRMFFTDTLPPPKEVPFAHEVVGIADSIADALAADSGAQMMR